MLGSVPGTVLLTASVKGGVISTILKAKKLIGRKAEDWSKVAHT